MLRSEIRRTIGLVRTSQGYREIGGKKHYFRSRWEANYARYLEFLKCNDSISNWEYEPHTFWFLNIKRGVRSYLPDFKITEKDGSHYWVEVKGYFDSRSLTKIKRLKKYYPDERLDVVSKIWFNKNSKKLIGLIKDWE